MGQNDIFLIDLWGNFSVLKKYLKEQKGTCVYFGSFLPAPLKENGDHIILAETFLRADDYGKIDQFVWDLSRSWYKKVSDLGQFTEFDFLLYLFKKIKNLVIVSRLISQYQPKTIFCCDHAGDLWPVVQLYEKSLKVKIIQQDIPGDSPPVWVLKGTFRQWWTTKAIHYLDSAERFFLNYFQEKRKCVLADQKLIPLLRRKNQKEIKLIPSVLEGGLRIRLEFLKKGEPYFSLEQRSRFRVLPSVSALLSLARWKRLDHDHSFREQFSFQGINFYRMARKELKEIFLHDFPRIEANKVRVKRTAERLRPAAILLRNEKRELEKSCVFAAKSTAMRSVVLQHGVYAIPVPDEKHFCDINAVWGEHTARYLVERGFSEERCVITGNPEYDWLAETNGLRKREELCQILNFDPRLRLLVLASQRAHSLSATKTDDEQQKLILAVLEALRQIPEAQLAIKVHPFEDERPIRQLVSEGAPKNRVRILKETDLFPLLACSDLVIVYNSTVGLSAMVLGKPVVAVNLTGYPDTVPYVSWGAAAGVYQKEDLAGTIRELLQEGERRQKMLQAQKTFVKDYAFEIDGKATERLLHLLENLPPIRPAG